MCTDTKCKFLCLFIFVQTSSSWKSLTWFFVSASCTACVVGSTGPGCRTSLSNQLSRPLSPSWTLTDWATAVCSCSARSDTDAEREPNLFSKPSEEATMFQNSISLTSVTCSLLLTKISMLFPKNSPWLKVRERRMITCCTEDVYSFQGRRLVGADQIPSCSLHLLQLHRMLSQSILQELQEQEKAWTWLIGTFQPLRMQIIHSLMLRVQCYHFIY